MCLPRSWIRHTDAAWSRTSPIEFSICACRNTTNFDDNRNGEWIWIVLRIVQRIQPDDIYNLAAQSHVQILFETPECTANADGLGALRLLEVVPMGRPPAQDRFLP